MYTKNSMVGTSVSTPTVVAKVAGDSIPNNAIATATASSKKLDAPIIPAGAAMLYGSFNHLHAKYAIKIAVGIDIKFYFIFYIYYNFIL